MTEKNVRRVTCVKADGYPVSLVINAVYKTMPDAEAAKQGLIRVIDESGEDYLYPESYFVPVEFTERPDFQGQWTGRVSG